MELINEHNCSLAQRYILFRYKKTLYLVREFWSV
jgi:hypothetical protein